MLKEPDQTKEVVINEKKIKIFQFNSDSEIQKIEAKIFGSVSKVINCEIDSADLNTIPANLISRSGFGLGAAAKMDNNSLNSLGEVFGMNNQFFLAPPSKVGAHDPYFCVKDRVSSPFFFYTNMDFGAKIPKFTNNEGLPLLEGNYNIINILLS